MAGDCHADASKIMTHETCQTILDAMYEVLDQNTLFAGREHLYAAMTLVEQEYDRIKALMTNADATHIAQHLIIDAMKPLSLTDDLKQHIVQHTTLYDASPRA